MSNFRHYFWTPGEPWRSIRTWGLPRLLRALHSTLMCTLRISVTGAARLSSYLDAEDSLRPVLMVCWHDMTLLPLHFFRNKNIGVMMSTSRSGQIQATLWNLYGWPTVWGSTNKREGVQALRESLRLLRMGQSFALTPDGPKGPRHRAQPGVIYLATHASVPVIPVGVASSATWRLRTWDRYFIPKPFARVHIHIGEPLIIPPDTSRQETPHWQAQIEQAIDETEADAAQQLQDRYGLKADKAIV